MSDAIAIVGMACEYPDAHDPAQLWENVLAQRRAFRRLPPERLRVDDYFSAQRDMPDATYSTEAAVLEGYQFDRVAFRIVGSTYEVTDPAHWLALDVASRALADAGFPAGDGLPRESAGVFVGNTLTGDFSRACNLRLRWPYVRRITTAALEAHGIRGHERDEFLDRLETQFKAPFPAVNEESLAGSLSNTIAGRICGHFDLKGGGYTLDGACASSLLAVANACEALRSGRIDVAIAGGVDLSLDPFELIGFAKAGALAANEMRVFDQRSSGFWPGEGCGFVVLMRQEDALNRRVTPYADVKGWGISSDGKGGITRPEVDGQLLVLQRAYTCAGYDISTVRYFEAHGTGTQVGDDTELRALSMARKDARSPAAVGSIKANIGHTKAAAGAAGLIKAALATYHRILPPTTGCEEPHPLADGSGVLRVLDEALPWPDEGPARAGVSALGFGGINAHIAVEGAAPAGRNGASVQGFRLPRPARDCELFLFGAESPDALAAQLTHIRAFAAQLSRSELTDLAAALQRQLTPQTLRAAVVAATAAELHVGLTSLVSTLESGGACCDWNTGIFLDSGDHPARVGYLFPGQGIAADVSGGMLARCFASAQAQYARAQLPAGNGSAEAVQPTLVAASLAGLAVLKELGIEALVAVGHSLGELTALHWAGALDEATALGVARARGAAMDGLNDSRGAMAAIEAAANEVARITDGTAAVTAAFNSPRQTVISGDEAAVAAAVRRAESAGFRTSPLAVTHGFHSPQVAPAAPPFAGQLAKSSFLPVSRRVISTVTGHAVPGDIQLGAHLVQQLTSPVRFTDALAAASGEVDLFIEVGAGRTLRGLVEQGCKVPVVCLDVGSESLKGLLLVAGWAFARGIAIDHGVLFRDRFSRPFDLDWKPLFLQSPCEKAPVIGAAQPVRTEAGKVDSAPIAHNGSELDVLRELVAQRATFPVELVADETRLLKDLNLNSMLVAELVVRGARTIGRQPPADASAYARASFAEFASALLSLPRSTGDAAPAGSTQMPPGIRPWTRTFETVLVDAPLANVERKPGRGEWLVLAPSAHPLKPQLDATFATVDGHGAVVIVPDDDETHLDLLLAGARHVARGPEGPSFVLVQDPSAGCASFARSLHLELPGIVTRVVSAPLADHRCAQWVAREIERADRYSEASYDLAGLRKEPRLLVLPARSGTAHLPITSNDVVLVTGGGKGITAECALALAEQSGATFALIGRADPQSDPELRTNLARFAAAGARCQYFAADLTDERAARRVVAEVVRTLGPITALIHGAGVNRPTSTHELTREAFEATLAAKVHSVRHLLAAIHPDKLRLLVSFSSIIARLGFERNADYAVANERLTALTEAHAKSQPHCRCLAIEWSAWSGVGMAEKVGMAALRAHGVEPIPVREGVATFLELLGQGERGGSVVVTGRFGQPATMKLAHASAPPHLRFLEKVWLIPGVELVAEAILSTATDPYLDDHVFGGQRLLPGVIGLEAMAEAALAVTGATDLPWFEEVHFHRALPVPRGESVAIRLIAQVREDGAVEVVVRCRETDFAVDHFRAVCRFDAHPEFAAAAAIADPRIPLDPDTELYGPLLFHTGRFRRIAGYRQLSAKECTATIRDGGSMDWFGGRTDLWPVLGDAAARDAALHAIQACIPQATVLPTGVDRMFISALPPDQELTVHARERLREGDTFTYDLIVADRTGRVCEQWLGLHLRAVAAIAPAAAWPEPLLRPYLERKLDEFEMGSIAGLSVIAGARGARHERSEQAIRAAAGQDVTVRRDEAGRPFVDLDFNVSAAHAGSLTFAVAGSGALGCDVEPVLARSRGEWAELLGPAYAPLAQEASLGDSEMFDAMATRLWAIKECLTKAGLAASPTTHRPMTQDGWLLFSAGRVGIATWMGHLRSAPATPFVFAVLAEAPEHRHPAGAETAQTSFTHIVGFDESNLVGNVYFAHYLRWQESARDAWLRRHEPDVLARLYSGKWVVRSSRCEFQHELFPGDEMRINTLVGRSGHEVDFTFTYLRGEEVIAKGSQTIGSPSPAPRGQQAAASAKLQQAGAVHGQRGARAYDYRHAVTFEETQATGAVHHLHYFRWQGGCREMFLREFAPDILTRLADNLCLVTKNTACEFHGELAASDDVRVKMRLEEAGEYSVVMDFEYWRVRNAREELVARGRQTILVMERTGAGKVLATIPDTLKRALQPFIARATSDPRGGEPDASAPSLLVSLSTPD